jgi:single-stranded DNA-binding protein
MIDQNNMCILVGGLTRDPEMNEGQTIVKMGLGVDRSGSDSASKDNTSGYFDLKIFIGDKSAERNPQLVRFVKEQIAAGNLKKGSKLHVVGRMVHERWEKDGAKMSKIIVYPEAISYAGPKTEAGANSGSNGGQKASVGAGSSSDPAELAPPPERF